VTFTSTDVMPFSVAPLEGGCKFGAQVSGLTAEVIARPEVAAALRELWTDRGVLVFRGIEGAETQIELSRCFGTLEKHPFPESRTVGQAELVDINHVPGKSTTYRVNGAVRGAWLPWHSDLAYMAAINRGGILRPIELPDSGGQTGFIDQIAAYESLPEPLKAEIEGRHVVYAMDLNVSHMRFGRPGDVELVDGAASYLSILKREFQFPRVLHPLVYEQAETGRKVLHVSPWFAQGILECGGPAGEQLLHEVVNHCIDPANAYFHQWRADDMVLWDNWRTLHCATGIDPAATRRMQRTTIAGDYSLGSTLGADVATLPRVDV
jgi:taurine dioxygenase